MPRPYATWTSDEIQLILDSYQTHDVNWLAIRLTNHTKMSISRKIANMGLTKPRTRKCSLEPLLSETPEAYYWIGFLMADGHFSDRAVSLTYSAKDIGHVQKLKDFLDADNDHYRVGKSDCYRVKFGDVAVVASLRQRFAISTDKTNTPCDLSAVHNPELLFALCIGFIDGDGCISATGKKRNYVRLSVVGDRNWLPNFRMMFKALHDFVGVAPTNMTPYLRKSLTSVPQDPEVKREFTTACWHITNRQVLLRIKNEIARLDLPRMSRKWDLIPSDT